MRCLILGGAGFMGSHVADALVTRGHSVRIFDLPNVSTKNLENCINSVELKHGDFNNTTELSDALEGVDIVIHLVYTTLPGPSNENPAYDVESNVIGTLNLLEKSVQKGIRKVVFASSGGTVYGAPKVLPIPETHETNPLCSYGITKLAIEKYLALYHHLHGLDYSVLRFGNPYGERQRTDHVQGAVAVFLGNAFMNKPITIWGDGSVSRDYFYIGDLVSAVIRVVETPSPSRIYNIASGEACSLNKLLSAVRDIAGVDPVVNYTPGRKLDVPVNCLDVTRASEELEWRPEVGLKAGLARTWEWIKNNG